MPEISLDKIKDLHRAMLSAGETTRAASLLEIIHKHEPPRSVIPAEIQEYADAVEDVALRGERGGQSDWVEAEQRLELATKNLHEWLATVLPAKD